MSTDAPSFIFPGYGFCGRSYQPNVIQAQPYLPVQMRINNNSHNNTFKTMMTTPFSHHQTYAQQVKQPYNQNQNNGRFDSNCIHEHPIEESKQNKQEEQKKPNKCTTFHYRKYCQMGSMCNLRHEYKTFKQLMRHYYTVKMYCLESLFQYSMDQETFVNKYETGVKKLPIF